MKPKANPEASISAPTINGIIAPPTMAVHNNPEPFAFNFPEPFIAKVKIVGNITELNNPTSNMDHMAINPEELIEITNSEMATTENKLNTLLGAKTRVK